MVNTLILGFSGPAGAGKDEAAITAHSILDSIGIPTQRYSFAFPLKEMCKFIFDMTDEELSERELKEQVGRNTYGLTNRRVMQLLGTESFREVFDENIWIDVAERLISKGGSEICIISDVRFENEARWVKENGILVHIDPTGREGFEVIKEVHASEAGYETEPDHIVENIGTVEEFRSQVGYLVNTSVVPLYKSIAQEVTDAMAEMNNIVSNIKGKYIGEKNGN